MTGEIQLVITVASAALSVGVAYGVVKMSIKNHEEKFKRNDGKFKDVEDKIEDLEKSQQEEIRKLSEKIEHLEIAINRFLDRDTAEKKFVTQRELELHLRNIDQRVSSIEKQIKSMDMKLDEVLRRLPQ